MSILSTDVSSPAWSRANNLALQGNHEQLRQVVNENVSMDPSLTGLMRAVSVLDRAQIRSGFAQSYRTRARELAREQMQAGFSQPLPWVATAKFALEDRNASLLRNTADDLLQRFPENPHGHYFQGVLAIEEGNWKSAELYLRRAKDLGLSDQSLAELLKLAIDQQRWVWEYALIVVVLISVWLLGFLVLYLVGRWLSIKTLKATKRKDPHSRNALEHHLRNIYRGVINLAGIYYYISLPMILITSLALPLALGYAALMLPYLNLWLVGIVFLGGATGVVTAISGIRTALVSTEYSPNRRVLTEEEAPEFWKLARAIAKRVGTRPVDEIWITPQTDMCVFEQGSWLACLMDRGKRTLVLGAALLPGFKVGDLSSVLAHEYAHFQHRDTAGGAVALRVRLAIGRFVNAVNERGVVRWWDISIWYMRVFLRMFFKLDLGASRLQEVLADRVAVQHFGASALVGGLQHVIRRGIEFDFMVGEAVHQGTSGQTMSVAFYAPRKSIDSHNRIKIENQFRDLLQIDTTEADTHPSPKDRFAAARRSGIDKSMPAENAVALFGDSAKTIVQEMSKQLDGLVDAEVKRSLNSDKYIVEYLDVEILRNPSADLLETRAAIHYRRGEYDLAMDDLNVILEHIPNDVGAYFGRSTLLERIGDYSGAAADLKKLWILKRNLPKDVSYQVAMRLGELLLRCRQFEKAASVYNSAIKLDPAPLSAKVGRLITAHEMGDLKDPKLQGLLWEVAKQSPEERMLGQLFKAAGLSEEYSEFLSSRVSPAPARNSNSRPKVYSSSPLWTWLPMVGFVGLLLIGGFFLWNVDEGETATSSGTENQSRLAQVANVEEQEPKKEKPLVKETSTDSLGDSSEVKMEEETTALD